MAIETFLSGMPQGHTMKWNAPDFIGKDGYLAYDSTYYLESGVKVDGADKEIFDSGLIQSGDLEGFYDIYFIYDFVSTSGLEFGNSVFELEVYKDGSKVTWTSGNHDGGSIYISYIDSSTTTTCISLYFSPNSTYQLKLVTQGDMDGYTPILDYVRFDLHNQTQPFQSWINPTGSTNTGSEIWMIDTGTDSINGNGTPYTSKTVYPHYRFKVIEFADATAASNYYMFNCNRGYGTGFTVYATRINSVNWSSGTYVTFSWFCYGVVEVPVVRPLTP